PMFLKLIIAIISKGKKRSATDLISTSLIIPEMTYFILDNEVPLQADGSLDIFEVINLLYIHLTRILLIPPLKTSTNRQYTKVPRESVYDADELSTI
ncbi:10090_t:CDS:1, partial [Funneliformis mosseae]